MKRTRSTAQTTESKQQSAQQQTLKGFEQSAAKSADEEHNYPISPDFWDTLLDSIPPWGDEIAAIVLIVFGVVSMLALVNASTDASLSAAWSSALTSLFGYGSVLVAGGILALGIIILLPKMGIVIKFQTVRILAIETAFLSVFALLHLAVNDPEMLAVARAGQGGGYIGWGLTFIPRHIFGSAVSIILFASILIISIGIVVGIKRSHIQNWLKKSTERLNQVATQLINPNVAAESASLPTQPTAAKRTTIAPEAPSRNPLMRIRPNPESLPPSLRQSIKTANGSKTKKPLSEDIEDEEVEAKTAVVAEEPEVDVSDHPLFEKRDLKLEFNTIGKLVKKKRKTDDQMAERPDGRVKRYFSVESMKEAKKVGKRDKSLPPLELLQDLELNLPDEQEINHNVVLIENTLLEFDIDIDVVDVKIGPTVTQYAVQPFRKSNQDDDVKLERTRLSRIASLSSDLTLALSAKRLRLEIPVPGHSYMGVEVPNKNPSIVALRSVYESQEFHDQMKKSDAPLLIPLGRDVSGAPVAINIATLPHLLIAGTTGSGKSVCIAAMASALILNNTPDKIKLIMLDPKMVELSRFNGLPHLLGPVETDQERIIGVLRWCTREMDRRYKLLEEHAARNIDIFNSQRGSRRRGGEYLPYIVIMIDEVGDLMMNRPEETEKTITRLAQMARAVGMHLVVATQRPSVDVLTGLIKANFPARISFAVASTVDSRVILDAVGAENLLGKGDMLYVAPDASGPKRLQGCFIADDEVRGLTEHWRKWKEEQIKAGTYDAESDIGPWERGLTRREFLSETDPMLEDAIELVVEAGEASASLIQRRLGVGYPRAARIMDLLEELGVVGESVAGGRARRVLIKPGKDPFKEMIDKRAKNQS